MLQAPPLSPPPRVVPATLALRVLFGGVGVVVSGLALTLGGALATLFVGNSTLLTSWQYRGELARAEATVTATEETSASSNNRALTRVTAAFEHSGRELVAISYCSAPGPAEGAAVEVEWPVDAPETARVVGMRERLFPGWVGFTLLVPAAALAGLALCVRANRRRLRLMKRGRSAWAMLTAKERTRTQINGQFVHRLVFEFVDERGARRSARERTHDRELFDDQVARHVLYEPDGQQSCVVELVPGRPRIEGGAWRPAPLPRALLAVAPPALAALAVAIAATVRF